MKQYKYAVVYTDGGYREVLDLGGTGLGIHGYFFNTLTSVRYVGVPHLITPTGYQPKLTGEQLKNPKYNPTFENWDIKLAIKDCKVEKELDGVLVNAWQGIDYNSAQRGELLAFIALLESEEIRAEYYYVHSDSKYLVNGYNNDLAKWKKAGWKRADGSDIAHPDLWKKIDELKSENITLVKIKAHSGDYGNDSSDRNATYGVARAINRDYSIEWVIEPVCSKDYWEPFKPIPNIMRMKWCYSLTNRPILEHKVGDVNYFEYMVGDHNKTADDVELLGSSSTDAGYALIWHNERVYRLDKIRDFHTENMWEHNNVMYKSDVINMINLSNISGPKLAWELSRASFTSMWLKSHRNDLISVSDALVSKMQRPPRLSYRLLDEEAFLRYILKSYLKDTGREFEGSDAFQAEYLMHNDFTDKFYETTIKADGKEGATKMTQFYDTIARSITVELENPCTSKKISTILTRGIHLPDRNMMSNIADQKPKVTIVTWKFSQRVFKHAVIIETPSSYGIWCGNYSNLRLLKDEDL